MIIQVTPLAEKKLRDRLGDQPGIFKLFYDTVDCGCDGINVLLIMNEATNEDTRIEAGSLSFVVSRQQEIFYEDKMRLDAEERFSSFKLDSDSQIYGNNILVRDMRTNENTSLNQAPVCKMSTVG
ncbi:iron-sulfur cluster biosynthesis family protein [Paenibacillus wynnii]|uniref:iron-sulfur cluster biosynthesis family protein n=1 Tax=Paenibacillus wynnii TaxID=268407 RepID=UPI002791079A|nr:iron-sulfur cluster biosynthesis family protein [Paenibacillus wynnii]MDQ0192765.1 uncharacterized protein YqkB [Paenibacillus wynnii]